MNSSPILLESPTDNGRRLTRIEAKSGDSKDEHWLQELLYRHPELLPVEEFDESFAPAIPIGREIQTGRGPLDNLFVSPTGGITIVETKLWKNPEKHRTVVAQVIDYAKELATWNYDDLCKAVLASSRSRKEAKYPSLEDKVREALEANSVDLLDFQENLLSNLQEGNFLLLIVGDRISPNIALLTEAIHSAPGLGFKLGLVEMRLYPLHPGQDWPLVVVPDVVGRIVEKVRGVVQVRYEKEKPEVSVEIDDEGGGDVPFKNLEAFLDAVPKDLVPPFRDAVEKWKDMGGELHVTNRMVFFRMALQGVTQPIIRCRINQVRLVSRQVFAEWSHDHLLYERYLEELDASPVVGNVARSDKQWVMYKSIAPDDLRVLLHAGMELASRIREAEVDD